VIRERDQFHCDRTDAVGRNDVVGERCPLHRSAGRISIRAALRVGIVDRDLQAGRVQIPAEVARPSTTISPINPSTLPQKCVYFLTIVNHRCKGASFSHFFCCIALSTGLLGAQGDAGVATLLVVDPTLASFSYRGKPARKLQREGVRRVVFQSDSEDQFIVVWTGGGTPDSFNQP
jgi:hypothetical protein